MSGRRSTRSAIPLFVIAGWLFADLFVGTSVLFLVGNSVAEPTPTAIVSPTATFTPTPIPTPVGIDPNDVDIVLSVANPGTFAEDASQQSQFLQNLQAELSARQLTSRHAALILTFSGQNKQLADAVNDLLRQTGGQFSGTAFRGLFNLEQPTSYLELDIFFFV